MEDIGLVMLKKKKKLQPQHFNDDSLIQKTELVSIGFPCGKTTVLWVLCVLVS